MRHFGPFQLNMNIQVSEWIRKAKSVFHTFLNDQQKDDNRIAFCSVNVIHDGYCRLESFVWKADTKLILLRESVLDEGLPDVLISGWKLWNKLWVRWVRELGYLIQSVGWKITTIVLGFQKEKWACSTFCQNINIKRYPCDNHYLHTHYHINCNF